MNKKKYLTLFLCALFLLNMALNGLQAETMAEETEFVKPLTLVEETLPLIEFDQDLLTVPTETTMEELTPTPAPMQDLDPEETPKPEMTFEPEQGTTEKREQGMKVELRPESTEIPQIERKASKSLPSLPSSNKTGSMSRAASSFNMEIEADTKYINLNDGLSDITWTIYAQGGTGTLSYAFDVYKNDELYLYMSEYGFNDSYSFTPTEPGKYKVRAFIYEWYTGREQIKWSSDTGVSTLSVDSLTVTPGNPKVGDLLIWNIQTTGGIGKLSYSYTIQWSPDGDKFYSLNQSNYLTSASYSYRAAAPGFYYMDVKVIEDDIADWYSQGIRSSTVKVTGFATVEINGVSANKQQFDIGEPITWTVDAINSTSSVIQYEFHDYAGDIRIESTDWTNLESYTFTPQRSGRYRVEVSVRDSVQPERLYTVKSDSVGVSNLQPCTFTADKTSAYIGDTVIWTVKTSGGSGQIKISATLNRDGPFYDSISAWEDEPLVYTFTQPGNYKIEIKAEDQYRSQQGKTTNLTVRERPAPVISSIEAISASGIKVSWNAVTGASGYELSRCATKTGEYSVVYTGPAKIFTNAGLVAGAVYYYQVRAYKSVGGSNYFGASSLVKPGVALAKPAAPAAASASKTSAKVTWAAVKGAGGYELWRSTSPNGAYARVYRGAAKAYTNRGLSTRKTYYYKVKAYKMVGSVSLYSPFSAFRAVKPR